VMEPRGIGPVMEPRGIGELVGSGRSLRNQGVLKVTPRLQVETPIARHDVEWWMTKFKIFRIYFRFLRSNNKKQLVFQFK
jgi:hypothetical protein